MNELDYAITAILKNFSFRKSTDVVSRHTSDISRTHTASFTASFTTSYRSGRRRPIKIPKNANITCGDEDLKVSFTHEKYGLARVIVYLTDNEINVQIPSWFSDYNTMSLSLLSNFDTALSSVLEQYVDIISSKYDIYREFLRSLEHYDRYFNSSSIITRNYNEGGYFKCNDYNLYKRYAKYIAYGPLQQYNLMNYFCGIDDKFIEIFYTVEDEVRTNYILTYDIDKDGLRRFRKETETLRKNALRAKKRPKTDAPK